MLFHSGILVSLITQEEKIMLLFIPDDITATGMMLEAIGMVTILKLMQFWVLLGLTNLLH